eukprot:12410195-Karenia_brevis.AAC.1
MNGLKVQVDFVHMTSRSTQEVAQQFVRVTPSENTKALLPPAESSPRDASFSELFSGGPLSNYKRNQLADCCPASSTRWGRSWLMVVTSLILKAPALHP